MTYQEYTTHLKICEYLGRDPLPKYYFIRNRIWDFWRNLDFTAMPHDQKSVILHKDLVFYGVYENGCLAYDIGDKKLFIFDGVKEQFVIDMFKDYLGIEIRSIYGKAVGSYCYQKLKEQSLLIPLWNR
jgi:hypothetical protein